ncbi:hypothetical protein KVV02_007145 [Mortierella alpina]|uniref:BZIP domain-containing protein n=1 Tax=Mortierella alpina TaxID=64518 RepID=A0A9P8CX29_MORAP|nr:hypothetical protein KVV02_007145 [Mortierella alpina]
MTFNGISEANVEEMSNAELFQYLFKAELDTETLFQDPALAVSPSSSTLATSPRSQYSSPAFDQSPATSSLSYSSPAAPPPYQHIDAESPQDLLLPEEPADHIQPLMQLQAQPATTYPTLLPSTSFSYRQISPHMPPNMPAHMALPLTADTEAINEAHTQFLSLTETVTAAAASSASLPPQQMNYWMQRFQQLQQLQQLHHQQQQQLLTSTFGTGMTSNINSSSERSLSPSSPVSSGSSGSPTVKTERDVIYPSPPMKDDVSMDSDSDCGPSHHDAQNGPDPLKPSPSELKKMTSKERRQLRNKLSARNFRVRRKEYIGTLETQVKEARREAADLQKKLAQSELNCQFLRQELETARLSQTLFNDGRLSREHANLLASLLNPNTEAFPTSSSSSLPAGGSTMSATPQQQQKDLMDSINHNNMTILNNSLAGVQTQASSAASSTTVDSQGAIQPFVPFDGNWELIVNRVEMVVDPSLDPKDVQSKQAVYHDLLTRYEAARQEAEMDEQMRTELKAYHDQKLAQTYIVMPKDDAVLTSSKASQDTLLLQTMVYMMMIHLTQSLFEAATLSKTQLVNVYQTMDEPLRSKMGQEQQERHHCKFAEWREAWIRKCWPSFYNNRQRVCELIKNGLCPSATSSSVVDVDETVRQMEEGVKGRTVETQPSPLCLWIRSYLPSWLKCPERAAQEEREALLRESSEKTSELAA